MHFNPPRTHPPTLQWHCLCSHISLNVPIMIPPHPLTTPRACFHTTPKGTHAIVPQMCAAFGPRWARSPSGFAARGCVWGFVLLPSVTSREARDCQCYADAAVTYARLSPLRMTHLMKGGRSQSVSALWRKSHLSWPGSSVARHISTAGRRREEKQLSWVQTQHQAWTIWRLLLQKNINVLYRTAAYTFLFTDLWSLSCK